MQGLSVGSIIARTRELAICEIFGASFSLDRSTETNSLAKIKRDLMTEHDATRLTVEALQAQGTAMGNKPIQAIRQESHIRKRKKSFRLGGFRAA